MAEEIKKTVPLDDCILAVYVEHGKEGEPDTMVYHLGHPQEVEAVVHKLASDMLADKVAGRVIGMMQKLQRAAGVADSIAGKRKSEIDRRMR